MWCVVVAVVASSVTLLQIYGSNDQFQFSSLHNARKNDSENLMNTLLLSLVIHPTTVCVTNVWHFFGRNESGCHFYLNF